MKEYSVSGMSCAACSARVEGAVRRVEGVRECTVSLLTNSMTVEGDYREDALFHAVEKAGYGVSLKGDAPTKSEKNEERDNGGIRTLLVSALLLVFLMYVSMGHMLSLPLPPAMNPMAQGIYQLLLSLWILLINRRFFLSGMRALLHRSPNMDTLVSLGSGVSFLYSLVLLFQMTALDEGGQRALLHGLYFESAAMILVLISVGKYLESRSKGKTTDAIRALQKLSPETASVLRDGKELSIPLGQVQIGDRVVIRPGEQVPVDGSVLEGEGAVDESALTGESIPADKVVGDPLYCGTANLSGRLVCRVEKSQGDTALSRIIDRVTAASASKAPIARLADRVSAVFVPVVMALALLVFVVHLMLQTPVGEALSFGIAVLVVSCPCALGLATPVAIMVANGVAARHGVLFKTAASLEQAGKTRIVVLDKTGTVTTGKMQVSDVICAEGGKEDLLLSLAASLEEGSAHPIAKAIGAYAEENHIAKLPIEAFQSRAGFGVEGVWQNERIFGGKRELLEESITIPETALHAAARLSEEGKTPLFFGSETKFYGLIALSDTLKEDAADAVCEMKSLGLRVVMITGDRKETATAIAVSCGVEEVYAGVLPEGKEELITDLKKEGRVMMVGDGINDAPALTAADTGVAIGAGMDVAMDASEVVLMNSAVSDVPALIRLSRKTLRNVKQNLFWAFCYNIIGIPLAAGAFLPLLGWRLTPMFGAAAMSFSSTLVVSNALRLNLFAWGEKKQIQTVEREVEKMEKVLKIEGMMCPHCEAHVKKALEALDGVEEAIPSHVNKEALVRLSKELPDALLKETVEKEGYKVL